MIRFDEKKKQEVKPKISGSLILINEGTLTENTVKGENGGRKCDIELRKPAFKCAFEKLEFTLTNFMRKGVTTKEKVSDFIMWDDKLLKRRIIEKVFCYYS